MMRALVALSLILTFSKLARKDLTPVEKEIESSVPFLYVYGPGLKGCKCPSIEQTFILR